MVVGGVQGYVGIYRWFSRMLHGYRGLWMVGDSYWGEIIVDG